MTRDLLTEIRIAMAKVGGQKVVAMKMGISESDLSKKLNGNRGLRIEEVEKFFDILGLRVSSDGLGYDNDLIELLSKKLTETMHVIREMKKEEGG